MLALFKSQILQSVSEAINGRVVWAPFVNNADTVDPGLLCLGEMNRSQNQRS